MLTVTITSDQPKRFKTTLAILLHNLLENEGISSTVKTDSGCPEYVDQVKALLKFAQTNPVKIIEKY